MSKRIQLNLAKAFSAAFHPLLLPLYLSLTCLFARPMAPYISISLKLIYLGIAIVAFVTLPALILALLKSFNIIASINLERRKDRILPFFLIAICYQLGIILLTKLYAPHLLIILMNGATISIALMAIVSAYWKISAHMTGAGGALASIFLINITFYTNYSTIAIIICLLAGGLGWARLYLERHTIKQVAYGFMAGFCLIPIPYFFHLI